MFDDFDDGDFADLGVMIKPKGADLVMSCVKMGRTGTFRVQFNFAPEILAEIAGHRYSIGFAISRRTGVGAFRIAADQTGRFEAHKPGRGERLLLRCPVPAFGFAPGEGSTEPEFFVNAIGKMILVEVPDTFVPAKQKALPAPLPPPVTTAKDNLDEETRLAVDRHVQSVLVGNSELPRVIGGEAFTPSERSIIAALLAHPQMRREGLLAACHDPENGEDERDPKLVDVFLSKLRPRLKVIGVEIERSDTGTYRLGFDSKTRLRQLIAKAEVTS